MKGLLVLGLGLVALAAASRLTLQERVVDLVLEAFHNRSVVQWMYKEQGVEEVTEREYPAGSFVRLWLRLQQTQCPNRPGSRQDCALKRRGRRQICLACVKFDSRSPSRVLDSHMHCRTETQHAVKGDGDETRGEVQDCAGDGRSALPSRPLCLLQRAAILARAAPPHPQHGADPAAQQRAPRCAGAGASRAPKEEPRAGVSGAQPGLQRLGLPKAAVTERQSLGTARWLGCSQGASGPRSSAGWNIAVCDSRTGAPSEPS
ncbi:unnamed protein product [Eretmochelys imbricata]